MKTASRISLILFVFLLASSTFTVLAYGQTTVPTHELIINTVGEGSVEIGNPGPYQQYDLIELTAHPAEGWTFDHWWIHNATGFEIEYSWNPGNIGIYKDPLNYVTAFFTQIPTHAPTIESCDLTGTTKDTFAITDNVYLIGDGFSPSTTYDLYIVRDVASWTDGTPIPTRVFDTATTVSSDADGNVPATLVWSELLVLGKYDIVVDVNGNGVYDEGADVLDDNDVEVTAGLNVIPEVPLGTVIAGAAMVIAFGAYKTRRPKRPNKQINSL